MSSFFYSVYMYMASNQKRMEECRFIYNTGSIESIRNYCQRNESWYCYVLALIRPVHLELRRRFQLKPEKNSFSLLSFNVLMYLMFNVSIWIRVKNKNDCFKWHAHERVSSLNSREVSVCNSCSCRRSDDSLADADVSKTWNALLVTVQKDFEK